MRDLVITSMFSLLAGALVAPASARDLPDGVFLRLDEFAPDGRYLGPVLVRGAGDAMMDTLVWLGQGRVAIMRGDVLTGLERWRDAAVCWENEKEVVPEVVVCAWKRRSRPARRLAAPGSAHQGHTS